MHHLTSLQDKIVSECQALIDQLKQSHTAEDLVEIHPVIYELSQKIGFLKVLKENPVLQEETELISHDDVEEENFKTIKEDSDIPFTGDIRCEEESTNIDAIVSEKNLPLADEVLKDSSQNNDVLNENSVEDIHQSETAIVTDEHVPIAHEVLQDFTQHDDVLNENSVENIPVTEGEHLEPFQEEIFEEELIAEAPISEEAYERSVQLVENKEVNADDITVKEISETEKQQEEQRVQEEKKFRLAQIKGLNKNVPSLFEEEEIPTTPVSSIGKSNMPTDYMEVPKAKPDFKLDLNDKIAFSRKLFGGSQSEMNEAIRVLNTFDTLDEAKEYLSDIYYKKSWGKVDEYAQRLWALVENKFL